MDAKPLIIVLIFIFILAIIASGIIGNVDLTDSGVPQPMLSNQPAGGSGAANPGVMAGSGISSSSGAAGGGGGQPVTGKSTSPLNSPCGSSYTVKSGDTLSSITRTCLISLEDLLAVNPSITDKNVISVGQKITIYHTNSLPINTKQPAITQVPTLTSSVVITLPEGLNPGDPVKVEVGGLPPNAQVRAGLDRTGKVPTRMSTFPTDANGVMRATFMIPPYAQPDETWTVLVRLVGSPRLEITAVPFTIQR